MTPVHTYRPLVQLEKCFSSIRAGLEALRFKIDTGGYVFSCLFDTGAEVSCMNVDTCTALGLLDSVSDINTQVNTASGQDMGVLGHVMVTFKLGKQSFTHKFLVCRCLTRPFILGEDYLSKNCMSMEWAGNRRAISYRSDVLATASQEVMEEPLKLCNAIKIPARSFVVAPHILFPNVYR